MRLPFSERTLTLLRQAGWREDRAVDTSGYEKALRQEGYPVHPAVVEFLRQFGGIRVVYPAKGDAKIKDEFHFDATKAAENWFPATVDQFSQRTGAALCVIGEASRGNSLLLMDPSGGVYSGVDQWLVKVADSGIEAIEALCDGKEIVKIP